MPDLKQISITDALQLANNDHITELKVDGTCMIWDGQNLVSERGIIRNDRFPHIVDELPKGWKMEGEIAIPGSHVLTVNRKENWCKAKFYGFRFTEIDNQDVTSANSKEQRELLDYHFDRSRNTFNNLRTVRRFPTIQDGWNYVEKQLAQGRYAEGIVVKNINGGKSYKIKKLIEMKLPIIGHEDGALKGAFLILCPNGVTGKVSGSSVDFVAKYKGLASLGKTVYAEIECQFLTDDGKPFQPRLRNVDEKDKL